MQKVIFSVKIGISWHDKLSASVSYLGLIYLWLDQLKVPSLDSVS